MLTIIGDIHGKYNNYLNLIKDLDDSIQLGDFGFEYDCLEIVDSNKHKMFGGNHDNYDQLKENKYPHDLGDFGSRELGGIKFFFIRGGYSIDFAYRKPHISWWPNEELSPDEMYDCVKLYEKEKPDIVISHECPASAIPFFSTNNPAALEAYFGCKLPSSTGIFLDELLNIHAPNLWVFGHHHKNCTFYHYMTKFIGLGELGAYFLETHSRIR